MTVALGKFRLYADEFGDRSSANLNDEQVEAMITEVSGRISLSVFGLRADEALARLAAHEFTLIARRRSTPRGWDGVGPVVSMSPPQAASISLGAGRADIDSHEDDNYAQTSHGLAYLAIRDSRACVGFQFV